MNLKTIKRVLGRLPPNVSVLLRGPTGIGKSWIAGELAGELGVPYIDVRLAQMTEGDVIGYPDIERIAKTGVQVFARPSWYARAQREPCVINFDEVNRAEQTIQQAVFQVVLDRCLGSDENGEPNRLHPETRVIACINVGNEYAVQTMDPALLRRFAVFDVETTADEWCDWATTAGVSRTMVSFVRGNPSHFRVDPSKVAPGTVAPCPASLHRLDSALRDSGLGLDALAGDKRPDDLYPICSSFVGAEAAIALCSFVERCDAIVDPKDVVKNFSRVEKHVRKLKVEGLLTLMDAVVAEASAYDILSDDEAMNLKKFTDVLPDELFTKFHNAFNSASSERVKMKEAQGSSRAEKDAEIRDAAAPIIKLHRLISERYIDIVRKAMEIDKKVKSAQEAAADQGEAKKVAKSKK